MPHQVERFGLTWVREDIKRGVSESSDNETGNLLKRH